MSFEASRKSAEAFRTISEVAVELDLPQHVLRFWEGRFPQVHPLKRAGGRRYYRPEDLDLLRGIHRLLYGEGLTIRGVQKILREQGLRYVCSLGRGEIDFMTPLRRGVPSSQPFGATDIVEDEGMAESAGDVADPASNVHPFPARAEDERNLTQEQRVRLQELLGELLAMKSRLAAAKANCSALFSPL